MGSIGTYGPDDISQKVYKTGRLGIVKLFTIMCSSTPCTYSTGSDVTFWGWANTRASAILSIVKYERNLSGEAGNA